MNSFTKVLKSRTVKEAICNIPDSFFEMMGFIFSMIFVLNPMLYYLRLNYHPLIPSFFKTLNPIVAYGGIPLVILFVAKYLLSHKGESLKKLFDRHWAIALMFVFGALMIISTIVNGPSERTIFGFQYRGEGLIGFLSYLMFFMLMATSRNEKHKKILIGSMLICSVFPIRQVIIDHYSTDEGMQKFVYHNANHFGYYLAVICGSCIALIVFSNKLWIKLGSSAILSLTFLALLANNTYGAQLATYVGAIFVCIVCAIIKGKFKVLSLIPIGIIAITMCIGAFTSDYINEQIKANNLQIVNDIDALKEGTDEVEETTGVQRIELWVNGLALMEDHAFLGTGADTTAERLTEVAGSDRCHCEYLNYAMSYGVPAMAFYIAAILAVYLRALKHKKELTVVQLVGLCAAICYLVSALVGNTMYYTAPYLFILLGIGYFKSPLQKEE